MEVLLNPCIGELDRIIVRGRRKSCVVRHAANKIISEVSMKIAIDDIKRCNIPAERERERERLETVSQRRGVDRRKSF